MSPPFKSSLFSIALVALAASGREARAQVTYVGTFAMTNGATITCLTDQDGSLQARTPMVQKPWAAIPAQQWAFFLLPNGYFAIMNVQSTLFLEASNLRVGGFPVNQFPWNAGLNQMWYLYPLGSQFYALVNVGTGTMLTDPNVYNLGQDVATMTPWTDNLNQWWYLYFLRN